MRVYVICRHRHPPVFVVRGREGVPRSPCALVSARPHPRTSQSITTTTPTIRLGFSFGPCKACTRLPRVRDLSCDIPCNHLPTIPRQGANVSELPAGRRRNIWGLGAYVGACPMAAHARRVRGVQRTNEGGAVGAGGQLRLDRSALGIYFPRSLLDLVS